MSKEEKIVVPPPLKAGKTKSNFKKHNDLIDIGPPPKPIKPYRCSSILKKPKS